MMREEERGDVSDKTPDGKNFSRLDCECQKGGEVEGRAGRTIHNRKCEISQKPKPGNRLKGSLNIYIIPSPSLPFLCPYFLKNQITQIPGQEKLMVQPNNIMEITYDFEGKESLFITPDQRNRGGKRPGTSFNILSSWLNKRSRSEQRRWL